ncbi:glycosyl transferase [Bacteroidia bacterium]|nr:glycosyl transferase [Bacteroidia bacterium]
MNNGSDHRPAIAIMLLVHKNELQVNKLIKHLSKDFDIYVHIDKRSSVKIQNTARVFVYKKYRAYWGSFNQIMVTLFLLKEAYKKKYNRYVLISGQDLPLKTNGEIEAFFDNNNYEYIDIGKIPRSDGLALPTINRVTHYYANIITENRKSIILQIIFIMEKILMKILKARPIDYEFYGGANWMNLTHNCVRKIFLYLEKDKKYIRRYKWTRCADEIFYQTVINTLDGLNVKNDCLRYIDWLGGGDHPSTLREEDYAKIMASNALFARKFDIEVDKNIVELIYKKIEK